MLPAGPVPHATVTIRLQGRPVAIDVRLAPLIEALWARAIETVSSCEDTATSAYGGGLPGNTAYVAFSDRHDARRFARTCRGGRAVDRSIVLLPSIEARDLDSDDAFAIAPGTTTVVFPAERIEAIAARLSEPHSK